ncbi:hypothetical protein G7K_6291-t1 [Saitoella complicata NRRL Y-17804]|uniref:Uncharacterized protein n=1 Tax=Saitoella complicata (strain BCRC 22490 / CBS 7301 / JCM 7358 / NBRC 10748 / NRRL Y-17804) TaxID=698492 RepID=A0A0E9NQY7_SAICN|nr:hypothetical protein G7K_6291-t1 [Saitoella complicata NRRL Y-17804]
MNLDGKGQLGETSKFDETFAIELEETGEPGARLKYQGVTTALANVILSRLHCAVLRYIAWVHYAKSLNMRNPQPGPRPSSACIWTAETQAQAAQSTNAIHRVFMGSRCVIPMELARAVAGGTAVMAERASVLANGRGPRACDVTGVLRITLLRIPTLRDNFLLTKTPLLPTPPIPTFKLLLLFSIHLAMPSHPSNINSGDYSSGFLVAVPPKSAGNKSNGAVQTAVLPGTLTRGNSGGQERRRKDSAVSITSVPTDESDAKKDLKDEGVQVELTGKVADAKEKWVRLTGIEEDEEAVGPATSPESTSQFNARDEDPAFAQLNAKITHAREKWLDNLPTAEDREPKAQELAAVHPGHEDEMRLPRAESDLQPEEDEEEPRASAVLNDRIAEARERVFEAVMNDRNLRITHKEAREEAGFPFTFLHDPLAFGWALLLLFSEQGWLYFRRWSL